MSTLREVVDIFYHKCLTVNPHTNTTEVLGNLLTDDFQSINADGSKGKQMLMGQIAGFWKMMPDLTWTIQETIEAGNQIVVRSLFGGSPVGNFFGIECDGTRRFETMSIDIHTIENGHISKVYHLEEWATAFEQLKK